MRTLKLYEFPLVSLGITLAILAVLGGALLATAGCSEKTTNVLPPTVPPMPIAIQIGGSCAPEVSSVNCCDDSEPRVDLTNVSWRLLRGVATEVETKNTAAGDCVTFGPQLVLDTYAVEQTVTASDGGTRTKTYSNLQVMGI